MGARGFPYIGDTSIGERVNRFGRLEVARSYPSGYYFRRMLFRCCCVSYDNLGRLVSWGGSEVAFPR